MTRDDLPKTVELIGSPNLGGGELVGIQLASALIERKQDASLWVPKNGPAMQESLSRGIVKTRLAPFQQAMSSNPFIAGIGSARFSLAAWRYGLSAGQIVHTHCPIVYRNVSRPLKRFLPINIVHVHIDHSVETLRWSLQHPPNCIVTCAQFLKERVHEALSGSAQRQTEVEVVPNAVDVLRFAPRSRETVRQELGIDPQTTILLMLANLAPHKGQECAIQCVRYLKNQGRRVELWLAGTEREKGGYQETLSRLAAELNVTDAVKFLGFRSDSDRLLQVCNVLLLPSVQEGMPLTILEAQACKRLVIAAPTAGIPEIILDGQTGFLVPADAPQKYAERVALALDRNELYESIVERAYEQIQRAHTWDHYVEKMIGIYKRSVQASSFA